MKNKKRKIIFGILALFVVIYFAIPPYNKIAQLGYAFNNLNFNINNQETEEYVFHRNNAIYLTRMDDANAAIREMDRAVAALPMSAPTRTLFELYRDRAYIKMYYGDYRGALNDFLRIPRHGMNDYLAIAMLFKEVGKKKLAISYCNRILDMDTKAYAGYACIADIYASAEKYDTSIRIYDLLIDRSPDNARYYADRALYKEKAGDIKGSNADYKKAKELLRSINYESSITYDAIHPKKLSLTLKQ